MKKYIYLLILIPSFAIPMKRQYGCDNLKKLLKNSKAVSKEKISQEKPKQPTENSAKK